MAHIGSVVLKVADARRAAEFWTRALGYELVNGPIGDESPVLAPKDGNGPTITLDEDDRTHLDLHVTGEAALRAEVERLVGLGAVRVPWTYPPGAGFVVLADTEGTVFCVVDTGQN
ncbi:VOC family protein [Saccharothrix sp. 6-C]|uniref:VOC family protein n=1 Tax=Saccharothrix sp. 6-C TaxID=2781735 RepID=UPI00191724A5|nr:VOC family protein [Saccharothrix sp. 6-C]QQQ79937.1 VOC family protein [Saccharothrix sp. 6-C]